MKNGIKDVKLIIWNTFMKYKNLTLLYFGEIFVCIYIYMLLKF